MKNIEMVERFDQAHSVRINQLFWIAGSLENSNLKDLLEEMDDESFKKCFPEIYNSQWFSEYQESNKFDEALIDFKKFGFLAEIHIPYCENFHFENGKPSSWRVRTGSCRIEYVYAETTNGLISKIEKLAEKAFNDFVEKAQKNLKTESN